MTSPPTPASLGLGLVQLGEAAADLCQSTLGMVGLSLVRYRVLLLVEHQDLNQSELARGLGRGHANVSQTVRGMESAGLVKRKVPAQNQRESRVALTDLGQAELAAAQQALRAAWLRWFEDRPRAWTYTLELLQATDNTP